jgi:hypothetical protein
VAASKSGIDDRLSRLSRSEMAKLPPSECALYLFRLGGTTFIRVFTTGLPDLLYQ